MNECNLIATIKTDVSIILSVPMKHQNLALALRSDEGLTLEMSGFQISYHGNSTCINSVDKNQIFLFHSPADGSTTGSLKLISSTATESLITKGMFRSERKRELLFLVNTMIPIELA